MLSASPDAHRERPRETANTQAIDERVPPPAPAPYDELVRRVVDRHVKGALAITESHMGRYRGIFQPPTDDELALYDPPL